MRVVFYIPEDDGARGGGEVLPLRTQRNAKLLRQGFEAQAGCHRLVSENADAIDGHLVLWAFGRGRGRRSFYREGREGTQRFWLLRISNESSLPKKPKGFVTTTSSPSDGNVKRRHREARLRGADC